jgi:uncharacterized membrane-anchored protein
MLYYCQPVENITPPRKSRKVTSTILKVLGILLIVPAVIALFLGVMSLISGDGFSDAAPWWVIFLMTAAVLGLPGFAFLLVARFISKQQSRNNNEASDSK